MTESVVDVDERRRHREERSAGYTTSSSEHRDGLNLPERHLTEQHPIIHRSSSADVGS